MGGTHQDDGGTPSLARRFGRATCWIVDRSWLAYALITLISAVATVGYVDPHWLTDLLAAPESPTESAASASDDSADEQAAPPAVEVVSLSRADAVLVIESDDIFHPTGVQALRRMVEAIEALPYVTSVLWMDRVPMLNIFGLRESLFPKVSASLSRYESARDKALKHPLIAGQLLSRDGRTLLMLVNFDWLYLEQDEDCTTRLRQTAESAAAEFPDVRFSVLVTGHIPIHLTIVQTHERNELKYRIIGYSVVMLMAMILFRGISSVIIVALGPSLGIFWTLGILRFFDVQHNPFNDVVLPVMLSLVGLTDGVHLMLQIRRFRAGGMSQRDAARAGLEEVGLACFLTCVTTSIGFWSLSLAHHNVVQTFGLSCVLGVALTFVAVLMIIPLACASALGRWVPITYQEGLIERHMHRVSGLIEITMRRPRLMSWLGIVLTIVCCLLSLTLRPDERRSSYLPAGTEAVQGLEKMDRALGGLEFSAVEVTWSRHVAADSPEVLTVITKVDDLLRSEPLIGSPISIRSLVDALPGEGPAAARASLLELLPPALKRAFYTPEYRKAWVNFRVQDLGIARYGDAFLRIETALAAIKAAHPEFAFQLTGSAVWRWRNLYQIVLDLGSSLGSEAIIILCVLGFVYRSLRMGLIAMVPNLFPLAITGTYLVVTGQPLEIVSVCAFTVCLGLAVDDTIHFLTRYEEELPRCATPADAIRRSIAGVGSGMIMTTMVLVVGFSTVLLSDMRDQRIFASMGVLTLLSALVADLIFTPAMLVCFARPSIPRE